tara:strand:+ start:2017 stop:2721 length:705 start_codon:yes stop_codon:yes gene_type:complete
MEGVKIYTGGQMIPQVIHQVFGVFIEGKPMTDYPIFCSQQKLTEEHCETFGINYQFWDDSRISKFMETNFPEYIEFYVNLREDIQRADFIRYLILYHHGGLYLDLDICPIKNLNMVWGNDLFFVKWATDTTGVPYNAVMGSCPHNKLFKEIIDHCIESYHEKVKMKIYETWTGRFVFQTTGHWMLKRVLDKQSWGVRLWNVMRIHNKEGEIIEGSYPLFEDYNISSWFNKKEQY